MILRSHDTIFRHFVHLCIPVCVDAVNSVPGNFVFLQAFALHTVFIANSWLSWYKQELVCLTDQKIKNNKNKRKNNPINSSRNKDKIAGYWSGAGLLQVNHTRLDRSSKDSCPLGTFMCLRRAGKKKKLAKAGQACMNAQESIAKALFRSTTSSQIASPDDFL